jgi:hypothetical protein
MASPAPNVYADIDVSVVHVGEDEKNLNRDIGVGQSVNPDAVSSHTTGIQAQGVPGHASRLRPRRHKREYQYQYPHQRQYQHVYGNEAFNGQDECDEFELSGYGQFQGGSTAANSPHLLYADSKNHHDQQKHNSMMHARLHLDDLLLEEGLFNNGCHDVTDQEEFTLAMDVPLSGSGGRGGGSSSSRNLKALKKMQYLQLRQNRDATSQQQETSQIQQQQVRSSLSSSSSQATMDGSSEEVGKSLGSVAS